jgi:TolB-like protein/Tfp pilus assembly protein PilF
VSFLAELKQRKVIRVAMVYLVVAWVAIQVASIALPAFDAPAWTLRVLILLFALGFPLALLLTWALELTPEGIKAAAPGRVGNKRMAGVAAALMALAVGWYYYGQPAFREGGADPGERSIAVLPLVNMSGDPANDYFSDGLAETMLDMLAQVPDLKVIARTSSFAFKGKALDVREIGRQLGAAHLLEGSVQQAGKTLRITVQLVRSSDGSHVWSQQYDRPLADVFKIQDEVATEVVRALQVSLPAAGREHLLRKRTDNVAAYREYLKGNALLPGRQVAGMREALHHFERAIEIDPGYARAYVGASDVIGLLGEYASTTAAEREHGNRYLARALELAPDLGEAHVSRGAQLQRLGDLPGAEREFKRGIALAPGYATAYQWYGELLIYEFGAPDEALPMFQHAVALDPLSPIIRDMYASSLVAAGRLEQGAAENARLLAEHPGFAHAYDTLSRIRAARGDLVGALRAIDRQYALDPSAIARRYDRCQILLDFGATAEGKACMSQAIARDPGSDHAVQTSAYLKALEGDFAGALALIDDSRNPSPWARAQLLLDTHRDAEALALLQGVAPEYFAQPAATVRSAYMADAVLVAAAMLRTGDTTRGRALLRRTLRANAQRPHEAGLFGRQWWDAYAYTLLGEPGNACKALREAAGSDYFRGIGVLDVDPLLADLRARPCYRANLAPARAKAAAQVAAARGAKLL